MHRYEQTIVVVQCKVVLSSLCNAAIVGSDDAPVVGSPNEEE